MLKEESFKLLENGTLKKGCKVKLSTKGFEEFTEIDDAFIKKARVGEMEADWVVVIIDGVMYDSSWISEMEVEQKTKSPLLYNLRLKDLLVELEYLGEENAFNNLVVIKENAIILVNSKLEEN